jgi:hypothetical protein
VNEYLLGSHLICNSARFGDAVTNPRGGIELEVPDMDLVSDFYVSVDAEAISHSDASRQGLVSRGPDSASFYMFVLDQNGHCEI